MRKLDADDCAELIGPLTAIVRRAGQVIADTGRQGLHRKSDGSPVTAADEAAEASIQEGLKELAPTLPVISEEAAEHVRVGTAGGSYFLVDPLDGTREFISGRDEYTINVALMTDGVPQLGIIAAPALGLIWRGIVGRYAERLAADDQAGPSSPIRTRGRPAHEIVVMVSRSHLEAQTRAYLERLVQAQTLPRGSAIKFCRVAEGSADLYPRLAPTRDWDVAAGHAIVAAAGGAVTAPDGRPLVYGTAELLIPGFIASGDATKPTG